MIETHFVTLPVKKVFFKLTIPSVMSMFFSSIYMMADGIFVGHFVGSDALAAVNMVMPVIMILFAVSNMIAVGSSVKVSTALGEKNPGKARSMFSFSTALVIGVGVFFAAAGLLFSKPLIHQVIGEDQLAEMAIQYSRVLMLGLPFIMPLFAMDNFLRVCGKARYSMWINIIVSVLNIFLDWLMVAKWEWGISASALATVISMMIGSVFSFFPFFSKKITLYFTKPKIKKAELLGMLYNGSSEFLSSIASSVIATLINAVLLYLGGSVAVASYGIVMYIDTLLVGVLYGVVDSIQPAVSYNLGAGKVKRTFSFFKISCVVTAAISVLCMAVILIFPDKLAAVFSEKGNVQVMQMTVAALLLFAPSYLFTWFNMVTSAFLTAMDKPKESMIIMLFRTVLLPVSCLVILTSVMGVYGVFSTITLSSLLTCILAGLIWRKTVWSYAH
ncbi:MATE family efflux transporter [Intestinimonas sp. MSJ-38]|uniref:MATE family efflux transporter n=1 Tax=Intestinimonas sp. MSJ-38 TaxID=2841532 RepID=UPI001C0FD7B1|nr:MATE family efflux transporter [Intestinimonas sp. MSJ-38]MBU5431699.1 MATE family efflux transporter [Intestinimonas sp. MSJ-38]